MPLQRLVVMLTFVEAQMASYFLGERSRSTNKCKRERIPYCKHACIEFTFKSIITVTFEIGEAARLLAYGRSSTSINSFAALLDWYHTHSSKSSSELFAEMLRELRKIASTSMRASEMLRRTFDIKPVKLIIETLDSRPTENEEYEYWALMVRTEATKAEAISSGATISCLCIQTNSACYVRVGDSEIWKYEDKFEKHTLSEDIGTMNMHHRGSTLATDNVSSEMARLRMQSLGHDSFEYALKRLPYLDLLGLPTMLENIPNQV
jgi:hypothetical protein